MKIISRVIKLLFIFILGFDLLIIVLGKNEYYFTFLLPTGLIFPTLLTVIIFYLVAWVQKIKGYWVVAVTVVALIFLGKLFLPLLFPFSYDYITSSMGDVNIIIEHRDITLGQTNHFYNFYCNTEFLMVVKKLNTEIVDITTRGTYDDNLEVLGVNNAKWIEGEGVVFYSKYAETKVEY